MKLSVVGGAGRVGSTTLFQLVLEGGFQELAVCDIAGEAAAGEALDLRHGLSLSHRCTITSGGVEAGLARLARDTCGYDNKVRTFARLNPACCDRTAV